ALGSALAGSDRPLIITSGTGITNTVPGEPAMEDGVPVSSAAHPRAASEEAAALVAADGVNVSIVRLPQVHDTARQGLISPAIAIYREKGACAYVGDALSRRGPALSVGDRTREAEREISRRRRRGRSGAQHRGSAGPAAEPSRQIRVGRGSAGVFRLARDVRRPRPRRFERADAPRAGLGAERAELAGRPRTAPFVGRLRGAGVALAARQAALPLREKKFPGWAKPSPSNSQARGRRQSQSAAVHGSASRLSLPRKFSRAHAGG